MDQLDALIVRLSMRIVMLEQQNMQLDAEVKKLREAEQKKANGKPDSSA